MTRLKAFQIDTVDLAQDPDIRTGLGGMIWLGDWDSTNPSHNVSDTVRDGNWTMVATTATSDRPAPQPFGEPEYSIAPSSEFATAQNTSVIKMVHKYTTTKPGFLELVQVRLPFWDADVVSQITFINTTANTSRVLPNPLLDSDEWNIMGIGSIALATASQFEIWFEFYNTSPANSVNGGWFSSVPDAGVPASTGITIDNESNPTLISISHTDLDTTNRQSELNGVSVGSIIRATETGDANRSIEVEVTGVTANAGYTTYNCTLISLGDRGGVRDSKTSTISIDIPITQASQYSKIVDYFGASPSFQPSFATITSELYFDGVLQPSTTDAYGIDVRFQEATVSTDWDVIAVSTPAVAQASTPVFVFGTADGAGSPAVVHNASVATDVIIVDASAGDVTVQLHSISTERPRPLNIKRVDNSSNVVTVEGTGSPLETIDGNANIIISTQYDNLTIINSATEWHIL